MGAGDGPAALDVDLGLGAGSPDRTSPTWTRPRCTIRPGHRRLHVADLDDGTVVELDHARVGELAAALGVERGAVEDDLDLVALAAPRATGTPSTSRPTTVALARDVGRSR